MPVAKRLKLDSLPDDWSQAKSAFSLTLQRYLDSLTQKGALNVDPAEIAYSLLKLDATFGPRVYGVGFEGFCLEPRSDNNALSVSIFFKTNTNNYYNVRCNGTNLEFCYNAQQFATGGTVGLSMDGTGNLKFQATQNPSSDPNTLDDYKERGPITNGTITPQGGAFTTVNASYDFTKIGNRVFLEGHITSTNQGTATGVVDLTDGANIPLPANGQATLSCRRDDGILVMACIFNNGGAADIRMFSATNGAFPCQTGTTCWFEGFYRV